MTPEMLRSAPHLTSQCPSPISAANTNLPNLTLPGPTSCFASSPFIPFQLNAIGLPLTGLFQEIINDLVSPSISFLDFSGAREGARDLGVFSVRSLPLLLTPVHDPLPISAWSESRRGCVDSLRVVNLDPPHTTVMKLGMRIGWDTHDTSPFLSTLS